jgi:hypothetical protein
VYSHARRDFKTPGGCTSIDVRLKANLTGFAAYWDEVELTKVDEGSRAGPSYTEYEFQSDSSARYGTKEKILDGGQMGPTEAARTVTNYINAHAWPRLERLSQQGTNEPYLEGTVIGYGLTTDWTYRSFQQNGSSTGASTLLAGLLNSAYYIQSTTIKTNAELVRLSAGQDQRLKAAIDEVVKMSGNGDYWHIYIGRNRRALFKPINFEPKYYLQDGELRSSLNGPIVNPYLVVPGVVRDVAFPHGADYPGSPFQDRRDILLDEIIVEDGSLSWGIGDFER